MIYLGLHKKDKDHKSIYLRKDKNDFWYSLP